MNMRTTKIAILAVLLVFPCIMMAGDILIDDYYYELHDDNTAEIKRVRNVQENMVIPYVIEYNGVEYIITSLAENLFRGKKKLKSITIEEGITSLPIGCFLGCINLVEVTMPESLVEFKKYCFTNCSSIHTFKLPKNTQTLEDGCFSRCGKIKDFYIYSETPLDISFEVFSGVHLELGRLHVPANSVDAYRNAEWWGNWWKILPIEDDPDGIDQAELSAYAPSAIYGMNGTRHDKLQRGINIIRDKEGKTKKVIR